MTTEALQIGVNVIERVNHEPTYPFGFGIPGQFAGQPGTVTDSGDNRHPTSGCSHCRADHLLVLLQTEGKEFAHGASTDDHLDTRLAHDIDNVRQPPFIEFLFISKRCDRER